MAKKDTLDFADAFDDIVADIKNKVQLNTTDYGHIPDIIEFCNSKKYLNLPGRGINLYPMQVIALKIFYRGQKANEHIKLNDEEIELMKQLNLNYVLEKYYSPHTFRELVLVFGRRGGKDFLVSLMALYEAMTLLEIPGGCPYKYYGIDTSNDIVILTVATAAEQAHILFDEMKGKLELSTYFISKIGAVESDKIYLLTPEDKKHNLKVDKGKIKASRKKGSVIIQSGHSNSSSLLGKGIYALLLDEVASFPTTGVMSGERIYSALGPAMAAFNKVVGVDEDGDEIRRLDAKIISISSPRAEEGVFYKLYRDASTEPAKRRLAIRLPTWKVNLGITEKMLREEYAYMSSNEFSMEFGAEFSGTAGEKFIPDKYVDEALALGRELNLHQRIQGISGLVYYVHLDPAISSHNYALVVLHMEERVRYREKNGIPTKEKYKLYVVDHMKVWQPTPQKQVNVFDVDEYIIDLAKLFRIGMVTYDVFNEASSVQKLRIKGIPTKVTPFRKQYKMEIYDRLEHLLVNGQLALPDKGPFSSMLEMELKCLKKIFRPTGFQIKPDEEAQITTDDLVDSLAGAIGQATDVAISGYPKGMMVYMPQSRDGGGHTWRVGRGQYEHNQWHSLAKKFGW